MDNNLCLASIGSKHAPNRTYAAEMRRMIMFKLLFWDEIILTDSQFTTDPRMKILVGQSSLEDASLEGIHDWQMDFSELLQSGLIAGAVRMRQGKELSLQHVLKMQKDEYEHEVPFLQSEKYAKRLDGIMMKRYYFDLDQVAMLFKTKLLAGLDDGSIPFSQTHDKNDAGFYELINAPSMVLFSTLLDYLQRTYAQGAITQERYNQLYRYVASCYQSNIPDYLDINCELLADRVPLHLELGTINSCALEKEVNMDLRPTWVLNPLVLDYIPASAFRKVRDNISKEIKSGILSRMILGTLNADDVMDYEDFWAEYTSKLEDEFKEALIMTKDQLRDAQQIQIQSKSQSIKECGITLVSQFLSLNPVAGTLISIKDIGITVHSVYALAKMRDPKLVIEQYNYIDSICNNMLRGNFKIITKCNKLK